MICPKCASDHVVKVPNVSTFEHYCRGCGWFRFGGELIDPSELRELVEKAGYGFSIEGDADILMHVMSALQGNWEPLKKLGGDE